MPPPPDHVGWLGTRQAHPRARRPVPITRAHRRRALGAFGRLAAEYTFVDNIFIIPLRKELVEAPDVQRARRLDGHATDCSLIDAGSSPSGSPRRREIA
jgi:hypothetical protein